MSVEEFLNKLGKRKMSEGNLWTEMVKPAKVAVILGKRGSGKTACGMFLMELISKHYELLPVVVNFPRQRQNLLPPDFVIKSLEEVKNSNNSVALIDEGTTMVPAGTAKLEEIIKGFMALARQRDQAVILIFHASSDIGARILRGADTIILKEPSLRQIQWGSKDDFFRQLLLEAKEKLANRDQRFSYVDSEEPEFRGILENPLPAFWAKELSKAWAGLEEEDGSQCNFFQMGHSPSSQRRRWVAYGEEPPPEQFSITPHYERKVIVGFEIADPEGSLIRKRANVVELVHNNFPGVSLTDLENAQIEYSDFHCLVHLRR